MTKMAFSAGGDGVGNEPKSPDGRSLRTDGRNVRISRSTSPPSGVSATQWEDALGVPKPALHTAAPSLPRALAPQIFVT
jgi:hypothetical protein